MKYILHRPLNRMGVGFESPRQALSNPRYGAPQAFNLIVFGALVFLISVNDRDAVDYATGFAKGQWGH